MQINHIWQTGLKRYCKSFTLICGKADTVARQIFNFLLLCCVGVVVCACASSKAGIKSPELPARHWLDEAPGVPIENKEKLEQAVPNLYDPQKSFNFEECVYLTIQQSPLLVNSAVEIEIKKLALTDSVWKYLPAPRMLVTVTNNLTRYNMDTRDTPSDYGNPKMRIGFYAGIPNPVRSFFEHKAQTILLNLAIATHRKAVGDAILNIARAYLNLQAQREILNTQKELLPISREISAYWEQVENMEGHQGAHLNIARQGEKESDLTVEKTTMQEVMDRTQLKILAGVDPQQKMEIDTASADDILQNFDGKKLHWEDCWSNTEDDLLLRAQIKLADYDIMLAWAQYIPNMNIAFNQEPPAGQYQPPIGRDDTFAHLTFDFPLIDWGERYRGVQTARMKKAEAFHSMSRQRTSYANDWLDAEQKTALAETEMKLQQTRYDTAKMQNEELQISYDEGTTELPELNMSKKTLVEAKIALINAELAYKLAKLNWMYLANALQERFLGLPARDITQ